MLYNDFQLLNRSMSLIRSVGGLLGAANNKADAILGVAKGVLCLPSILSGLPGIAGGIIKDVIGSAIGSITGIISGLSGAVDQIIKDQINQITGAISSTFSKFLQAIATVVATIRAVLGFVDELKNKARGVLNDAKDKDKCRYAAATLLRCITSRIADDLSRDLKTSKGLGSGKLPFQSVTDKITSSLGKPGNVIDGYLNKASKQVDRATKVISAIGKL